jgi:hypothetical protein
MSSPTPLRFFWEIVRPTPAAVAALLAVLAYATYLAAVSDQGFDQALALVFLAQLLAASTGYRDRLVRGHFDALLAAREGRVAIALAHAALSVLPGLVLWLAFGTASQAVGRTSVALTAGGLLAFTYASTLVWTVSLWLGKNTGGVIWIGVLFLLASAGRLHTLRDAYGTVSADWLVTARSAGAAMVLPIAMLVNGGYVEPPVRVLMCVAIVAVLATGLWTIVLLDAPLKDPS